MTNEKEGLEGTPLEPTKTANEKTGSAEETPAPDQSNQESVGLAGTAIGSGDDASAETAVENAAAEPVPQQPGEVASAEEEKETIQEEKPRAGPSQEPDAPENVEAGTHVDYSGTFRSLEEGDLVNGVVVHIDKEGILVDVGTKSEGLIRPAELAPGPVQSLDDVVSVGDEIDVYVMQSENRDGSLILSKKRADFEKAWERLQGAHEEGKVITAMVTDRVKGGLVVDLGIRGFVPASHVGSGKVRNLEKYVGQSLPLKVIEVDRSRRKVILSHRLAVEAERAKQRETTLGSLIEGQIRQGVVRRITDYGAFVDLGGIDGLLHISEMSWSRINHPSEAVKVGQRIDVVVLRLNPEAGRVSLGLRQILPDPWVDIKDKYSVGDVIRGNVSRLVPFGAFVQIDGGVEGIIPIPELSRRRVNRPEDVVSVGQEVETKIVDVKPEERRITLSLRQMQQDKERAEYESYQSSKSDARTTLGDLVGQQLKRFASSPGEEEAGVSAAEEPAAEQPAAVGAATVEEAAEPEAPVMNGAAAEPADAEAEDTPPEPVVSSEAEVAESSSEPAKPKKKSKDEAEDTPPEPVVSSEAEVAESSSEPAKPKKKSKKKAES